MTRRQFQAHLQEASQDSHGLESISHVRPGDDDGQFTFSLTLQDTNAPISITASVTELSEYPKDHDYFIFAADNTPPDIASALQTNLSSTRGKTINQLLDLVSTRLSKSADDVTNGAADDSDLEEEDPDSEAYDSDADIYGGDGNSGNLVAFTSRSAATHLIPSNPPSASRVRADFKSAKNAGFRVAYFGNVLSGARCVVSISISARKLGISDEAMQAWRVEPSDYIILLILYPEGYKSKEQLTGYDAPRLKRSLELRIGASKRYKPTQEQVLNAFSTTSGQTRSQPQISPPFSDLFISTPLNNLLNDRLVHLISLRESGMTWRGAEDYYRENQGSSTMIASTSSRYYQPEPRSGYPAVVDADQMSDATIKDGCHSFPLVAMQFMLRHFVRCTEFCLVCHRKLDTTVEALKPYVCDSPLCLYQYISLGFGPSIEHEILTQESVVDLLVSFCYSSAQGGMLNDFPNGLALSIPTSVLSTVHETVGRGHQPYTPQQPATMPDDMPPIHKMEVRFDPGRQEILFEKNKKNSKCPSKHGDWVSIECQEGQYNTFHCRIVDTSLYPTVKVSHPITIPRKAPQKVEPEDDTTPYTEGQWYPATLETFAINFDLLPDALKRGVVCCLLTSLPTIKEMKEYLSKQHTPDLKQWVDRIVPAALGVLRWVIASNRSCILEVDEHNAVYGMKDWMQFRFAMGAPDKEHRFITAVRETTQRLDLTYPTLYSWHGSMIHNWHSIIREGLHFNHTRNGRAFGHGVYHSPQCTTSLGYSGANHNYGMGTSHSWPKSALQITSAIALNEIVNVPSEFVSMTPHYVVNQLDWIQTRYLFVRCANNVEFPQFEQIPKAQHPQDPERIPQGPDGKKIIIPASKSTGGKRKLADRSSGRPSKKVKKNADWLAHEVVDLTMEDEDETAYENGNLRDNVSEATDEGDLEVFEEHETTEDDERQSVVAVGRGPPQTDFVPGSLDHDTLPKLPQPSYANTMATRRLQQDFKALLKVQDQTPLHELGWYIDPSKLDNVYQWIVELHSFHMFNESGKDLPLVVDMKKHEIKSIVIEMRFPGSYPMNPPFIRVVRPRFLPFLQGGGGHVTAGGAICHMLLTSDGWLPSNSIESVLLQIRMAMASTDPKPARLENVGRRGGLNGHSSYGAGEAVEAYKRACQVHGWKIPDDFDQTAASGGLS